VADNILLYRTCIGETKEAFIPSPFKINDEKERKMKLGIVLAAVLVVMALACGSAMATPSTQIWIPSTDIQAYKTFHLGIDNYIRASGVSKAASPTGRDTNVYDIGPEVGILPFEKLQAEIGFDYYGNSTEPNDNHPWSGNFKIGTPEDSLVKGSPAIAVGMYNIGPSLSKSLSPLVVSGQNIAYALVAKTIPEFSGIPSLGRISAGYYRGSERALVNFDGKKDNNGLLLSWDRAMNEISDKLWLAVDYQSGHNVDSALNVGFSWNFAKNVSVIFGYDIYNDKRLAGNNTFTTQLDINFP
jgi:hypothetical protein